MLGFDSELGRLDHIPRRPGFVAASKVRLRTELFENLIEFRLSVRNIHEQLRGTFPPFGHADDDRLLEDIQSDVPCCVPFGLASCCSSSLRMVSAGPTMMTIGDLQRAMIG